MVWPDFKFLSRIYIHVHLSGEFEMTTGSRPWLIVAGILGATGVALGAIAAHAVQDPVAVTSLERASTYQILHAIALVALSGVTFRLMGIARALMLLGVVGFSGSIYAKYLLGLTALGKFAPTGGTALILSWLVVVLAAVLARETDS